MARLCAAPFRPNQGAARTQALDAELQEFIDAIVLRVQAISGSEAEATKRQLTELVVKWRNESAGVPNLVFRDFKNPGRALLVSADDEDQQTENKFPTLWSLRDVDASSDLYLIG
jgi:hypothetical protein